MAEITPRWEWRSFGRRFGEAEGRLAQLAPSGVQESDEIYLLSPAGGNVKIRDALMDIKVLQEVIADGLEQWTPIMKAGFPLPAAEAVKVLDALQLPVPTPLQASYTLDEFIGQVAAPGGAIRVVKVHKRRTRYTLGGCMAELSAVVANGERDLGGRWRTVVDRAELTRLGEGLAQQGVIIDAALERTTAAIAGMVDEAKQHGVRAIAAVGTAGLRIATNADEVVASIEARTGVHIEVISGEEEGRLAYVAAKAGLGFNKGSLVVFDTGGGSSQFTFGHDASVDERFSVDVGAVRYTERYGLDRAVSPEVLREAMAAISSDLSRIDGHPVPDALVAMGGAVTNITAVSHRLTTYDPAVVQGSVLDRAEIDRQIELYRSRDADARRSIVGLQPKRAEVILAGACIVRTVMEKLGKEGFAVSDRGLRHGVLAERFAA